VKPEIRVLDDVKLARIFMSQTRGAILKEMAVQPRSISQLARTLGISPPAVHYHIKILERAGLIAVTRVETVRNNLVEKFYTATSPCFMIFGEETSRHGPVPPKGRPDKGTWIAKVEGTDEYLSGFGLRIKEGCKSELEQGVIKLMQIISSHAQDLSKGLFAQLDDGLTKAQLNRIESLAATLAPIAVAHALDDPELIETLRSFRAMVEPE
jgi:DNA-binding transcriptional ArsR family regulator